MKKLAVLLMALVLLLCAAAQAETEVADFAKDADKYFDSENNMWVIPVEGDTVITGSTEYPVVINYVDGEITLRDVQVKNKTDRPGMWITTIAEDGPDSVDTIMVKLEGDNVVNSKKDDFAPNVVCDYPLAISGDGSLFAAGSCGLYARGSITVDGGHITAVGSGPAAPCALFTEYSSLTVNGGSVIARYSGASGDFDEFGAYLNLETESGDLKPGKVIAGSGYVIKAGETSESAVVTDAYNGEMYLEISKPGIPETGDGANLVLWTLMLAASVLGVLSMRRKAREC